MSENVAKFNAILASVLGISESQVTDALSSENVDTWDSLNHINVIGALEQEFGVTLPAENLGDAMSVPLLKKLLAEHGVQV